jgi:hypothetical protein
MKTLQSFLLFFFGFCFVISAVVALSTVIHNVAMVNSSSILSTEIAELIKMPIQEQILRTLIYAGELAVGALLIKKACKL